MVLGVLAASLLAACSASGPRPPRGNETGYSGPSISINTAAAEYVVVLKAPTAGWSFSLDEVRDRMGGKNVFVTVRRPNPAYLHAQAEVEQNLGTRVSSSESITVFARVLEYNDRGKKLVYYQAAGSK
jgi:hypothetical protein